MGNSEEKMQVKILIAEDEPDMAMLLGDRLKEEGYEIHVARDGKEALVKSKDLMPDLMLLDISLPKLDGFHVLQAIKKNTETAAIPVIVLTARADQEDVVKGIQGYAELYMTKPFETDKLIEAIQKTLAIRGI